MTKIKPNLINSESEIYPAEELMLNALVASLTWVDIACYSKSQITNIADRCSENSTKINKKTIRVNIKNKKWLANNHWEASQTLDRSYARARVVDVDIDFGDLIYKKTHCT